MIRSWIPGMKDTRGAVLLAALLIAPAAVPAAATAQDVKIDSETFGGLRARSIGPAAMSGRIAALDAVEEQRLTIYAGSAGGGVWKSVDGGTTFKPVFDKHCQSIGAVAIDRSDSKTVWVGTGESWTRNSVSVGDGLYKSTDGGDQWTKVGLEKSERIARIAIDPQRPDTVYVAATGQLWAPNPDRGLYRTRDGGKTWERVLFVNNDTGCADVAVDPRDPSVVYAAMWQYRRRPWAFSSGGPGSGLYKSTDGGTTWKKLARGLPVGDLGRIGIAIAPSNPKVLYAAVEAKNSAIFRSDDAGESWKSTNSGVNVTIRPFYFQHLVVDPANAERLYKCGIQLMASDDGGRTFSSIGGGVHSDYHAIWINPLDNDELLVGTDGGVYASGDRGNTWRMFGNLPVSQFYHVSTDMAYPYNVYGGLQDNGSWTGPSRKPGGIANRHWRVLGGGDGFWAFVDPHDDDITYVEYQEGNLLRVRKSTGESKEIKPFRRSDEPDYRWNWNSPIHMSPTKPGTMYFGSQFLFRSRDRGEKWERISPDLTTNDPAKLKQHESGGLSVDNSSAENHCTVYAISESPRNADLVWVGTDDGNIQLTRDAGRSWTLVSKKLPGIPAGATVSCVRASSHDEGTAFATLDAHALGDMKSYVIRTTDFGKTWTRLDTPDMRGYAHTVLQDAKRPELLFVGTEVGLFISLDGGGQWAQFKANLPDVAVRDMVVHPREDDLVLATHGRGIYILDDIRCLRGLDQKVLNAEVAFLESRPAEMDIPSSEQRFEASEYRGETLDESAFITYYLKKRHMFGDLKLEIYDGEGKLISAIPGGKRRGINRVDMPTRLKAPKVPPATNLVPNPFSFYGPRLGEGSYEVKLIKGKETLASKLELVPDPRSKHTAEDRAMQRKASHELYRLLETLTFVADAVVAAREQGRARIQALPKGDALARKLTAWTEQLDALHKTLVTTREGRLTGEEQLRERMGSLYGAINGYEGRPTDSQSAYQEVMVRQLSEARAKLESLTGKELEPLNAALGGRKLEPIKAMTQDDWAKKQEQG